MGCAQWAPAAFLLAALLLAGQAAGQANAPEVPGATGGWRQGRATFYGGPESFLQNFDDRGPPPEYGFGSAVYGSCGYTQQVLYQATRYEIDYEMKFGFEYAIGACLHLEFLVEQRPYFASDESHAGVLYPRSTVLGVSSGCGRGRFCCFCFTANALGPAA